MEKIINLIKKYENIFVIILLFISLIGVSFYINLDVNDELWNFQNVYKMYNGYQIYEDANVICTPLFFYIGNLLFNILGANFFAFRIYNILIFMFYYFMIYKILRLLKVNRKISLVSTLVLLVFGNYALPRVMANYNSLAVALCLLGIYLLIKNQIKMNNKNILIQSIICFLIILTKQNIGVFYLIAMVMVLIIKNKENSIKTILKLFVFTGIFLMLFLVYLKINGNLDGFINYTILGIKSFAINNVNINWAFLLGGIICLIVNIYYSIFLIRQNRVIIEEKEKNNLIVLNCFSIMLFFIIYPIANITHFLIAIQIAIILLLYILNMVIEKSNIKLRKVDKGYYIVIFILIFGNIYVNVYDLIQWGRDILSKEYYFEYKEPFYGTITEEELYKNIVNVSSFIREEENKGRNVIVFSPKAALYMVTLKQSNGFYDLPFEGNFGNLSEEDVVESIKKKDNTLILIEKEDKNKMWQENKKIIETLRKELKSIGMVEEFEIFLT